jgi:hypothetical protein
MKITWTFLSLGRSTFPQHSTRMASRAVILAAVLLPISSLLAQSAKFTSRNFTGGLQSAGTVNAGELASTPPSADVSTSAGANTSASTVAPELHSLPLLRPPIQNSGQRVLSPVRSTPRAEAAATVTPVVFRGFNGLTHLDQRNARNGNQFSVEPPDQALAVGNGLILEAINSGLNVYDINGVQKLKRPLALTEFFGLPPAVNRTTGAQAALPGDPVAQFDPDTSRWFVEAWAQLANSDGSPQRQSRIYLAVSQTSDPTGVYTIYILNTTDANDPDRAGPRVPDYAHIGLDRHGLFISCNEFQIDPNGNLTNFIDAAIFAISKQQLVAGAAHPGITRLALPFNTGYEFTVLPASTPPGANPFLNNGGVEFFVSAPFINNTQSSLAVWALLNTQSLDTIPALGLQMVVVNTQVFNFPSKAVDQQDGFRPLGASLGEPVETLDPGDVRPLSSMFTGGRLWATLGSEVTDQNGDQRMAAEYFAFSPKIVNGTLSATLATQGVVSLTGANLLRPAIAMNAQSNGGMVFTLVGPNDFPSSAFVPLNGPTVGAIQISRAGNEPEDGFSGYPEFGGGGTARWGDYAGAAVDSDGSILMATEYVPDLARTINANWSTYITRLQE